MQTPTEQLQRAIADALRPDPKVLVDQWAEDNRVLPPDTPEPGPFRNRRTPYLIDIQRTMSPSSPYSQGWFQKPHQVGGSVSGENMLGAWICTAAGSILVVFPTLDDAKQWELTRFTPMRDSTKELRKRIRPADEKGSANTKLRKKFPGGVMRLVGSNRVGALKSSTIRYVKFEEPDEYVQDLDDQGGPIGLAIKRTSNFGRKAKIYGDGTPTLEGRSAINKQVKRGDQRRWFLHCPDCNHPQHLVWGQMKWREKDPDTAAYACIECGTLRPEHAWKARNYGPRETGMTEAAAGAAGLAHWQPTAKGEPGVASWYFTALAAPIGWRPWPQLVSDWLAAQGDEEALKLFVNNILGECWTVDVRSDIDADALKKRAELYPLMTCPQKGLICVAGVDTQDNRLAVVIRAFGRGQESWGLHHGEIPGSPSSPETWAKLKVLLEAPIQHASGQTIRVDVAFIDAGGHHGEDVYAFCHDANVRGKHWCAIRGAKAYDAPKLGKPRTQDFNWRGKPVPGGVEMRFLGTQSIKTLINNRLALSSGPGAYHFPLGFDDEYFKQMRSEGRVWKRDAQGNKALWWEKGKGRNEAWDCEVYAYAAFLYGMSGQHEEAVWRAREKLFMPRIADLFELPPPGDETPAAAAQPTEAATEPDESTPEAAAQLEEADRPAPLRPAAALKRRKPITAKPRRGFAQRW